MQDFSQCNKDAQIERLQQLARKALKEFGIEPERMEPLVHAENTTFRVWSPQGEFCIRINRPGYQSTSNVRSEIQFLHALSQEGFRVPRPFQPRLVTAETETVPEPRDCVLFHWIEGSIHREGITVPQAIAAGELMAQLHQFVTRWNPPQGFDRQKVHTWLLDESQPMALDHPSSMIAEDDRRLLAGIVQESREMARDLPRDDQWIRLIHADLHPANLVFNEGILSAIDFDDTGYGFLIYDFAAALAYRVGAPGFEEIRDATLEGYSKVQPLPPKTEELLSIFIQLRLASISNWSVSRVDNPEFREISPKFTNSLANRIRVLRG